VLGTGAFCVVWLLGVWPPPVWWRNHEPRCTAMMRLRTDCRKDGRAVRPIACDPIGGAGTHGDHRGRLAIQDASRHRLLSNCATQGPAADAAAPARSRTGSQESLPLAVTIGAAQTQGGGDRRALELALSKDRIMALYLSVAEWGPASGERSRRAKPITASRRHDSRRLRRRHSRRRCRSAGVHPAFRPERMLARRDLILARYYGGKTPVPPVPSADDDSIPVIPRLSRRDSAGFANPPTVAASRGPCRKRDRSIPPVRSSRRAPVP